MRANLLTAALALAGGIAAFSTPAVACSYEAYVGTICTFPFNWCPSGFLPADGRTMDIRQNEVIYSLIGNAYGGNPSQGKFNLPDLRGRVVVGVGTAPGLPPVNLAQPFGQPFVTPNAISVGAGSADGTATSVASNQPIPILPPSLGMTVCIAVQGIYPTRP